MHCSTSASGILDLTSANSPSAFLPPPRERKPNSFHSFLPRGTQCLIFCNNPREMGPGLQTLLGWTSCSFWKTWGPASLIFLFILSVLFYFLWKLPEHSYSAELKKKVRCLSGRIYSPAGSRARRRQVVRRTFMVQERISAQEESELHWASQGNGASIHFPEFICREEPQRALQVCCDA